MSGNGSYGRSMNTDDKEGMDGRGVIIVRGMIMNVYEAHGIRRKVTQCKLEKANMPVRSQ